MEEAINYTTADAQVKKLKAQGLEIPDESLAEDALNTYGYSNLVKGYREPYVVRNASGDIRYRPGVSFEQILSLYTFDKNLRNAVMASMLDLEEHLKAVTADVVAAAFGTHQDEYLNYRNYRNRRKRSPQFTLTSILGKMRKTLETDKEPIAGYMREYGAVPPWILFKSVYFSTIVNYVDQLKIREQSEVAYRLYGVNPSDVSPDLIARQLRDTLSICNRYRNIAAHGGHVYDYDDEFLRLKIATGGGDAAQTSGFSALLAGLRQLKYSEPYERLDSAVDAEINRHCRTYPTDASHLEQALKCALSVKFGG